MRRDLLELLKANPYPGRGILLGRTPDGRRGVIAYFIMGRSENSRNRVFTDSFEPGSVMKPFIAGQSVTLCLLSFTRSAMPLRLAGFLCQHQI